MLCRELARLHHRPVPFRYGAPLPEGAEILLTFGPYGRLLPVWQAAAQVQQGRRPTVIHWNTEGMPDPRLPGPIMGRLGAQASRLARLGYSIRQRTNHQRVKSLLTRFELRMLRFRNLGDYQYAYRRGWLHRLADTSAVYAQLRNKLNQPTVYAPWGASCDWYSDLGLDRDIDVLWMGARGTRRRSRLLDQICHRLRSWGVRLHMADSIEQPFVFGENRTRLLNRSKITLNLTRTWYDDNFSRLALAAPNRSLIISEPLLPHSPEWQPGEHYVAAPIDALAETIMDYLHNGPNRQQITEAAYQLVTTRLSIEHTVRRLVQAAEDHRQGAA